MMRKERMEDKEEQKEHKSAFKVRINTKIQHNKEQNSDMEKAKDIRKKNGNETLNEARQQTDPKNTEMPV